MADIADRAQAAEEQFLRAALTARPRTSGRISLRECAECGNRIPEARRMAIPGCTLCTACQTEKDES